MMHHVFPHKKNKLALTVYTTLMYIVVFKLLYSFLFYEYQTQAVIAGVFVALILYDGLHYYFHFGP